MKWLITALLVSFPASSFSQPSIPLPKGMQGSEGGKVKVWKRDPFIPLYVQGEPPAKVSEQIPDMELSAVLFSDDHSSAVINGKVFHVGDEISGQQILDIKRTYVILGTGKKSHRLELKK